jgi:N-acetylmuramoyl-L-alanine amidase
MFKPLNQTGLVMFMLVAMATGQIRAASSAQAARPSTVVVIDAGHGGFDRGGIAGQRVSEKMMNLDVALRLRQNLQASGYRVVMTRDTDVFVPLGTRVAIANSYRNGIFVCIHFNAASRGGANGIETYFYSGESLPLASAIHYYVSHGAPSSNRGVRRRGYFVLRKTAIPAVLVECGFLTNPTEAQYAQSAAYRQQLADEIARGIRNRSSVVSNLRSPALQAVETVPLQPFIDQTRIQHTSRTASKSSKRRKSSHASKSDSENPPPKKKKKSSAPKQQHSED